MKSILVFGAETAAESDVASTLQAQALTVHLPESDGAAFEMLMDASVELNAVVVLENVPRQTKATLKQLMELEQLDFPIVPHSGSLEKLPQSLASAGL